MAGRRRLRDHRADRDRDRGGGPMTSPDWDGTPPPSRPAIPTADGMYGGLSDELYHSDRGSLSSSGARKLLPPSCPAIFRAEQDSPHEPKTVFDLGHAAHTLVLGEGAEMVDVGFDMWNTKAAKEAVAAVRADGKIPLKPEQYAAVHAMARSVQEHPTASVLLSEGRPELSAWAHDPDTGMRLRARPDWLTPGGIVDFKTSTTANPVELKRHFADFGYHCQQPFYLDILSSLGILEPDAPFYFIVAMKTPPYLVSVIELEPDAIELGRALNRRAIRIYAECVESGQWPGFGDYPHLIDVPRWAYEKAVLT